MFQYLTLFFALLYIIKYWNCQDPPVRDFISPSITILICCNFINANGISLITTIICCSLIFEATADLMMHTWLLKKCLLLFSIGHVLKQSASLTLIPPGELSITAILLFVISLILCSIIFDFVMRNSSKIKEIKDSSNVVDHKVIFCYMGIVGFTFLISSYTHSTIDIGYICYIISDLLIGFEIAFHKLSPRRFRVLVIPMLYWLGQYLVTQNPSH